MLMVAPLLLRATVGPNLIPNGDFSQGATGFASGALYVAPATDALQPANTYTLVANPTAPFVLNTIGTKAYFDHTEGNPKGAFMAVNGSNRADALVWERTVSGLKPGQAYEFSLHVSRWTPNAVPAARLQLVADDAVLATFEDPAQAGVWERHAATFVAHAALVRLQVRDEAAVELGNDFGLDDLGLFRVSNVR